MIRRFATLLAVVLSVLVGTAPLMPSPAFAKKAKLAHVAAKKKKKPSRKGTALARITPPAAVASDALPADTAVPKLKILTREEILAAPANRLERIGRHIIIGYHSLAQVKALVEARAIAGIFITDHNVRGRSAAVMKAEIDALQQQRHAQGLPPLIVAADQEGGSVSRLSPPLKYQRSLSALLANVSTDAERKPIVENFAREQAAELARIGVTMNFGPVVDLKLNPANRDDGETRLRLRAISADPYTVAKVAGWYCQTLAEAGLMCTLKHFPGLGRVRLDTHVASAEIMASEGTLELNDWVPFRRVMTQRNAVTMLGHVRIGAVDKQTPASYSEVVINKLIRQTWEHDGLLITDDFSMGAITRGKPGLGPAAVRALNAGVDLLLVSFSEKHLDTVLSALLAADEAGELDPQARAHSRARLDRRPSAAIAPSP